jgi:hypothetical protein
MDGVSSNRAALEVRVDGTLQRNAAATGREAQRLPQKGSPAAWRRLMPGIFLSTRTQLLVLILLPTVALVCLTVVYQLKDRAASQRRAVAHVVSITSIVAQNRRESLDAVRSFMVQLSQAPELVAAAAKPDSPEARAFCTRKLASTADALPGTIRLGLSDLNGNGICTNTSSVRSEINVADRLDFQAALLAQDFAIGEVVNAKTAPHHPSTSVSMPLYGSGRDVIACDRGSKTRRRHLGRDSAAVARRRAERQRAFGRR